MIAQLGISKKDYCFLGKVRHEDVPCLYRKADLFVLPSFTESCPLTVIEAMASGLPVIASDVGGMSEIISNRKDGLLVRPGDSTMLARGILLILEDNKLRKKIAKLARAKAEKSFSSKNMAEQTLAFYKNIMGLQKLGLQK
jgi:glycosyltransferase involved in cell wall biosynthesis